MIGIINRSRFLKNAILYNERKVDKKLASFIDAGYYLENPEFLTLEQKLQRLTARTALNQRSKVNTLTCSLSFDESEKLTASQLKQISSFFLKKIGFHGQPYLVYEHFDSSRQHVHIITTLIKADGSRINDKCTSKNQIRIAQKQTEVWFGLRESVDFGSKISKDNQAGMHKDPSQTNSSRIIFVLNQVLTNYKFSSLSEFNAILKQFNVHALKGSVNSRLFKNQGLVYRTLDQNGIRNCRAIKASSLDPRATLKALTIKFDQNRPLQASMITRLKNTVDLALLDPGELPLQMLADLLDKQGIKMHLTKQADESDVHLTYIDNRTKCAFDAGLLGENYELKGLIKRSAHPVQSGAAAQMMHPPEDWSNQNSFYGSQPELADLFPASNGRFKIDALLHDLLLPTADQSPVPYELRNSSKKRKKKSSHR